MASFNITHLSKVSGWYSWEQWLRIKAGAESWILRAAICTVSSLSWLYLGCKHILVVALARGQLLTRYPNAYTPCPIPHLCRMLMENLSNYSARADRRLVLSSAFQQTMQCDYERMQVDDERVFMCRLCIGVVLIYIVVHLWFIFYFEADITIDLWKIMKCDFFCRTSLSWTRRLQTAPQRSQ